MSYLNGLVVFPTFFNLSLNFATRSSWSEPQSAPSLVFADYIELLHLWLQRIQVIWFWYWPSGDVHVQSLLLCCWKRVFAMISAFSWQNSVSLCPASFCTWKPSLPVTPGISWLPTFAFQSSMMGRTSFLVLVLEGLISLHRTLQLQLLQHYCLGHILGLLWYWMACLGNELRSFCCFWDCTQVLHFRLFGWLCGLTFPFLLRDYCPQCWI